MTNEKNNINELVNDDDDSTAELEAITFRQNHPENVELLESDDSTFGFDEQQRTSDARTIGKLQYDIEQLRSKWLGLEAEIKAREEITDQLNAELARVNETVARRDKLLKTRDRKIKTLKSEIRDRDERHRQSISALELKLEQARMRVRDIPNRPDDVAHPQAGQDMSSRLAQIEAYADLLRRKFQDLLAQHDDDEKERIRLDAALTRADEQTRNLDKEVARLEEDNAQLREQLGQIGDQHAEEIRMLRFELGQAQETVSQAEILNSQLASDLVDTRGFKEELERMLCDSDEQSRQRIDALEDELERTRRTAHELEKKLEARSDAINVLLAELARKSEQMDSIGEIGDVISDIDERISDQFDEADESAAPLQRTQDRVTRLLVGKIGDKLLRFPLFKDRLTIGRTDDNDIQLNAPFISRRHAVVTTDGETTRVIDWGSKNGVFVNSERVTEHFLRNGDIVTIGNAHFRYDERPKRDN